MLYAFPIALGLLLWVVSTLVTNPNREGWSIALRVLTAVAFFIAALAAAGVLH